MKLPKIFNTNALHNLLNLGIAVSAGITAFMLATGCTVDVAGVMECSKSWVDPGLTTTIAAGLGALKTVINVARDGFGGLWKPQPPVEH